MNACHDRPTLHVLVGVQGAGKSAYRALRFGPEVAVVSLDRIGRAKNRRARERRMIAAALAAGCSVVVDNTNPTAETRQRYGALAREHGARLEAHFLDTPLPRCLAQNAAREGKARVPEAAVQAAAHKLELPTVAEGFHVTVRLAPRDDGTFQVMCVDRLRAEGVS